jgi:hypothetical protein
MTAPTSLARRTLLIALPAAAFLVWAAPAEAARWCGEQCDQVVVDWNAAAHQVIQSADGHTNPLTASRSLAMMHLAMHDAVNAVDRRYTSYAAKGSAFAFHAPTSAADGRADADEGLAAIAAVIAAHDVLLARYPNQRPLLQALLGLALHDAGGSAMAPGRGLGASAAAAVVAQAATKPFSMNSPRQFRVAAPPPLEGAEYASALQEVRSVGGRQPGARRSAEETQAAHFWHQAPDAAWNRIARTVARERPQNLWDRARGFAMLNAVLSDAYLASRDAQLHHKRWRPVAAIHAAASDASPATSRDAGWQSLLPSPATPGHPSAHGALAAAAATVLAEVYGRDRVAFELASPSALPEHRLRSFTSFSAAAKENADARVRAGLQFRFSTVQGLRLGEQIGRHAAVNLLSPLH